MVKTGSCSSGGVWRTAKRRKHTCVGALTVETGSCSSTVYCLAPASMGYYSSTVDLLQPPPATVHPRAPVHPASTARSSTGYYSTSPLHGVLFNHPSTGYCSPSPPPATVQPALRRLLFNQPSTRSCSSNPPWGPVHPPARSIGYCSSSGNGLYYGVLFIQPPTRNCSSKPPQQRSLFI